MVCAIDFASNQILESPEYFVYWGLSKMTSGSERMAQNAKKQFCGASTKIVKPQAEPAALQRGEENEKDKC